MNEHRKAILNRIVIWVFISLILLPKVSIAETVSLPWVDPTSFGFSGDSSPEKNRESLQKALDTGKNVWIPQGTYRVLPGVVQKTNNQHVYADGVILKTTADGTIWTMGEFGKGKVLRNAGLRGLSVVREGSLGDSTSAGIRVVQVLESFLRVGVENFGIGIEFTADAEGTVYNEIHLIRIWNCGKGIFLNPTASGWVNENNFYGGRFSNVGAAAKTIAHVYSPKSESMHGSTNQNKFFGPSMEGTASYAILDGGISNFYLSPRLEGKWLGNGKPIYLTKDSKMIGIITSWYATNILDEGTENLLITPKLFQQGSKVR